jgi:glycosyltransferase involved in cell wall biosynthesis
MILGIDASNIRRGGGVTHLVELLRAADPLSAGFHQVVVWSGKATLSALEERDWLIKTQIPELDGNVLKRSAWQRNRLSDCARHAGCAVLFVPGSSFAGDFVPMVTLSQNLLPFELKELFRFGLSLMTAKLLLLRTIQSQTFRNAQGLIFLTQYAKNTILKTIRRTHARVSIIPHGIDPRFSAEPKIQRPLSDYSLEQPFRFVYVSILDVYKHQDQVSLAVYALRQQGIPVEICFVGPDYAPARRRLEKLWQQLDPERRFLHWTGPIPYQELHQQYQAADACVFASSCENLPIILLEGMTAGLPIACSKCGPMPEVLGNAGLYFDPEKPRDIAKVLETLLTDPNLRSRLAKESSAKAAQYSWQNTAEKYFSFFASFGRGANE